MANHFTAIGFDVHNQSDFERVLEKLFADGEQFETPHGAYIAWKQAPGIELWLGLLAKGDSHDIVTCTPHFSGDSRISVKVGKLIPLSAEIPLEGLLLGNFAMDGDSGDGPPIAVDLPDFELRMGPVEPGSMKEIRIAAFAEELDCFPDAMAFSKAQSGGPKFASNFFVPSGMISSDPEANTRATAMLAGKIERYELLTNPFGKKKFHHLVVSSLPGVIDIVAEQGILKGKPIVGGIARGSFWLSGRLLDE